jgi:hypothetical protein
MDNPETLSTLDTQDTRQKNQHNMCWIPPCTRQKTKTNKTKNTTQYVLDTTMYKTKDEDKKAQKQPTKKPNKAQYLLYTNIRKQTQIT